MQPPTSPPHRPRVDSNRSLGAELALSLLTCLALVGGVVAAASTIHVLPGPSLVVVPAALVVALATAVAVPFGAISVGRAIVSALERLVQRDSSGAEPLETKPDRHRSEPPDRSHLERRAPGRLDGSDR